MRIPVQSLPTVAPTRSPSPDLTDGVRGINAPMIAALKGMGSSVERAGQGFAKLADTAQRNEQKKEREAEEARRKAEDIEALEGETEMEKELGLRELGDTERPEGAKVFDIFTAPSGEPVGSKETSAHGPTGLLNKRGKKASESYGETMEALRKRQKEIEGNLHSEGAKSRFRRRSELMIEGSRQKFERHIASENQQAAVEALKGREATLVDKAYRNPLEDDPGTLEGPIRSLARTPEGAQAAVDAHRALLAETRIKALISSGDWQNAERVVKTSPEIGDRAAGFEKTIALTKNDLEAERITGQAIKIGKLPSGRVDADAAMAALEMVPAGPLKDEARTRLKQQIVVEDKIWDEKVGANYTPAFTTLLRTRSLANVRPVDRKWLEEHAPEKWADLEGREQRYLSWARSAAAAKRAGSRPPPQIATDAERQAFIDLQADIAENPDKYADMSVEEFTTQWAPNLSDADYSKGGRIYAGTKDNDRVGASEVGAFIRDNKTAISGKPNQAAFSAAMGDRVRAFKTEKKRQPNPKELGEMRDDAKKAVAVERMGGLYRTTVPAYKAEDEARKSGKSVQKPGKVEVVNEAGVTGFVDAAKVDAWLSTNPKRKRK